LLNRAVITDPARLVFFSNLIDFLASEGNLIELRSKAVALESLDVFSENQKMWMRFFGILFVPLMVVCFGLWYNKKCIGLIPN
jgi:hypothetical protein